MKKLVLCMAVLVSSLQVMAEIKFGYDAGAEIVSSYIWRGQYNGGLSFQPNATVGFDAADEKVSFRIGAWGSVGASDWKFRFNQPERLDGSNPNTYFVPEVDLLATLNIYGLNLGATHYYYFGGTPFFSGLEEDGGSQTEVSLGYDFGVLSPVGLYFNWYTMVAGNDCYYEGLLGDAKRAWSSYIEVGYKQELPLGFSAELQVGMTPWRSTYTDYDDGWNGKGFAVTNIAARLGKEFETEFCTIDLFLSGSINPYNLNKENAFVWKAGDDKLYQQKVNGTIGVGIWF
ncbi:MAG: hypothetical protein J5937_03990 [Paludibacteraceae bacterium]|nr:hypothetical protein [Paludibacteraceae bacterium]